MFDKRCGEGAEEGGEKLEGASDADTILDLVSVCHDAHQQVGWCTRSQSWALSVFFNKTLFFCIFYQVNDLFLHQVHLKSPLPVKLT